jgi:hypothetical protein
MMRTYTTGTLKFDSLELAITNLPKTSPPPVPAPRPVDLRPK